MRDNQRLVMTTVLLTLGFTYPTAAQVKYGPGVTDTEIRVGNTMPYSGPLSAYATVGKAEAAYFQMINDQGGINGRKLKFISLDDSFSPPKTVEQTRRLVEEEDVLLIFSGFGTATNSAVQKYLNERHVPQLFLVSGATKWGDPAHFPWTMGWQPTYQAEGHLFAKFILRNKPEARIGVLYQNDDYGKDYLKGLMEGLGENAKTIVEKVSYNVADPTVDSQIVALKASGADVFYNVSAAKFASQSIRKAADIGWTPLQLLNSISTAISVLEPAGLEKAAGIVSLQYAKDPNDPQFKNDRGYQDWLSWMKRYYAGGDQTNTNNVFAYNVSMTLVQVLKQCGNDLTRENIMKQAANLSVELPMLLPGIKVSTGPTQFFPIREMQLKRFNGAIWEPLGNTIPAQ